MEILLPESHIVLELPGCPLVQMDHSSLDGMVLKVKIALLLPTLLFLHSFATILFGPKLLLEIDGINEEAHLCILAEHLILKRSSAFDDVRNFIGREQLFTLVEVQLVEHVLHHLVHFVRHF